jgi:hypothetical protein
MSRQRWSNISSLAMLLVATAPPVGAQTLPAGAVARFDPPAGLWLIAPDATGVGGGQTLYGATGLAANWTIGQWDIPEPLPGFSAGTAKNSFASVTWRGNGRIDLSQDGTNLPCRKSFPSGHTMPDEFDLFAAPLAPRYKGYKLGLRLRPTNLKQMHHLTLQMNLSTGPAKLVDHACQMNVALTVAGLVLVDPSAKQTFFYQLNFNDLEPQAEGTGMSQSPRRPGWFAVGHSNQTGHGGHYGFGDRVWTSYSEAAPATPQGSSYKLDVLPRLRILLNDQTAKGIDRNPAHWQLGGVFFGQSVFGHVAFSSQWQDLGLYQD